MAVPPSKTSVRLSDSVANFFKIILSSTIEDQRLDIPKKFALEYGEELSNVATLIVPDGNVWPVGLERDRNKILFVDGWQNFSEHYSLTDGQFLVFSYQGNSMFHVRIFDFSCCDIDYPCVARSIEYVDDDVCETLPSSSKDKGKEKCVDQLVNRKRKSVAIAKKFQQSKLKIKRMLPSQDVSTSDEDYKKMFVENLAAYTSPNIGTLIAKERQKLIHATKMFKLENPFFAVILQQGNIERYYMYVPSTYTMKYLRGKQCPEYIKLEDSEENQWKMRCHFIRRTKVRIGKGCAEFFRENNLKSGDVCLFELSSRKDVVLKFSVLRAAEYAVMVHSKRKDLEILDNGTMYFSKKIKGMVISRETKRAMKAAQALKIGNPAFMVILSDYYLSRFFVLAPAEFSKDHLLGCGSFINLKASNDECWPVRCTYNPLRRTMRIHAGFKKFCKDNVLEVGDVCVFELIKKEPVELKVSIFYASDYASVCDSSSSGSSTCFQ